MQQAATKDTMEVREERLCSRQRACAASGMAAARRDGTSSSSCGHGWLLANEPPATFALVIVRKTCSLDGRKPRSGFRHGTRPEQAISCHNPVQVHGPRREWKRKTDHEMLLGWLCTIKPGTLRPACTGQQPGAGHRSRCWCRVFFLFWLYVALRRPRWQERLLVRC